MSSLYYFLFDSYIMSPKKRNSLIALLVLLSGLTIAVYSFPQLQNYLKMPEQLFSRTNYVWWDFSKEPLIKFFQKITDDKDKEIESTTQLNWIIDGHLLSYWEWTYLSWSAILKTTHLLWSDLAQESIHYQIDWETSVLSWSQIVYDMLFNMHWESVSFSDHSFLKLDQQDIVQNIWLSPTVLLWQSLLNQYKGTWISLEDTRVSLKSFFQNSANTVRLLEISKEESYIEVEWPTLQFSWSVLSETNALSWSFSLLWENTHWSIHATQEYWTYILDIHHSKDFDVDFNWKVVISKEKNPSLHITWEITRDAWISITVSTLIDPKKSWSIKSKTTPKKSISRDTVQKKLLWF